MRKFLIVGIMFGLLYSAGYVFSSNISSQKKPAILFIGGGATGNTPFYTIARELAKEGFTINSG
ncbi:MAG: hypothetical protein M1501_02485, partial [Candidatus Omnitrophica bacterium]|nr:hypothetical protein [Candidatus Omnitrophota bacterium]